MQRGASRHSGIHWREFGWTQKEKRLRCYARSNYPSHVVCTYVAGGSEKVCGNFSANLKTQNFYTMVQALGDREVDLVLQYAHPSLPSLYDKSQFHSLVLARDRFVPVAAAENGVPVYWLDAKSPGETPLLRYSGDGFLSRVEELIYRRTGFEVDKCRQVLESPTSEVLKNCALLKQGVAWLPHTAVAPHLETGALALAGSKEWSEPLEVRVYGLRKPENRLTKRVWEHLVSSSEH